MRIAIDWTLAVRSGAIVVALASPAGANTKPPGGLTPGQYLLLQAAPGAPIVLPSYLPPGYHAVAVKTAGTGDFTVTYADEAHHSFTWYIFYGGRGGMDADPDDLRIPTTVATAKIDALHGTAYIHRIGTPPCYRMRHTAEIAPVDLDLDVENCGSLIAPQELARIISSTTIVRKAANPP